MAGSANFEDTTKPNQSPAAGGFDSERRSSGVSARWLLMQSIKKPSQAIQSLRRRWQGQPILRTDYFLLCVSSSSPESLILSIIPVTIVLNNAAFWAVITSLPVSYSILYSFGFL